MALDPFCLRDSELSENLDSSSKYAKEELKMKKVDNLPISVPDCRLPVNLRSNSAIVPFFFF